MGAQNRSNMLKLGLKIVEKYFVILIYLISTTSDRVHLYFGTTLNGKLIFPQRSKVQVLQCLAYLINFDFVDVNFNEISIFVGKVSLVQMSKMFKLQ